MIYEIIVDYATENTNQSYKYIEWSENENS